MVKIFYDKDLDSNIVTYTFAELFRYIDIGFEFVDDSMKADIIYCNNTNINNQLHIIPNKQFWNNYKTIDSLPDSPLQKKDDVTYIYKEDIIASTFFILSGYEEYLNPKRDKFNRFLYRYSYCKNDNIYTKPIVEQYREILIQQLNSIGIKCKRKNIWKDKDFGLFLTHDVDGVYKYRNIFKSIAKIFLKPSKFSFKELIQSKKDIKNDPYFKGFFYLIKQSNKYNFKSTFFFISKVREKLDNFYDINDKAIQEIMKKIKKNSFEIGLHGSLKSFDNKKYLIEEKNILNLQINGIRQHYLKYNINITPKLHDELFIYDTSLGFADMIGFRRGTCLPFKLYDLEKDKELNIFELPLIVMEQTLRGHMRLKPKLAYEEIVKIINMIKLYNGLFTFLWHPGNCSDEWIVWLKEVYEPILKYLIKNNVKSLNGIDIVKEINI